MRATTPAREAVHLLLLGGTLAVCCAAAPVFAADVVRYRGTCDASAAVALDAEHFAVASDERNTLAIYRRGVPEPVGALNLARFLETPSGGESDLEGAARIGDRIYWIASHGRKSSGEARPHRYRFFATTIAPGSPPVLTPVGQPYAGLLDALLAAEALAPYRLGDAAKLPPEAPGGLNIEGLAATPDGRLLIGFRSPLPDGRALLVPIDNPGELVDGKPPRLGAPVEPDLNRRGVRSIERIGSHYLIVAGPPSDEGSFALYRWSGVTGDAVTALRVDLGSLRPEALFAIPGTARVVILSDDGGLITDGVACKDRKRAEQSFRAIVIEP